MVLVGTSVEDEEVLNTVLREKLNESCGIVSRTRSILRGNIEIDESTGAKEKGNNKSMNIFSFIFKQRPCQYLHS
jgi:hypothetical protein